MCLLSFPPALHIPEEWSEVIDGYRTGDLTQHEMYRKVIRLRQGHYNFVYKDIETNSKPVITVIQPMLNDRIFWGAVWQEIELKDFFEKTAISNTFISKKYPFMQILQPTPSYSADNEGIPLFEKIMDKHLADINLNPVFKEWRKEVNKLNHESTTKIFSQTSFNHTGPIPANRQFLYPGKTEYQVEYRFMAVSFVGEFNNMTIPVTRTRNDTNLVVIVGQYVYNSDTLLLECN